MISTSATVDRREFEQQTGWELRPEGACKDDRCIPWPDPVSDTIELGTISEHLSMPLVLEPDAGLWALGPESGGKALSSAHAQDLTLPDWHGESFRLSSLRGRKVLLIAWASW
jgi:hypothetical protein